MSNFENGLSGALDRAIDDAGIVIAANRSGDVSSDVSAQDWEKRVFRERLVGVVIDYCAEHPEATREMLIQEQGE